MKQCHRLKGESVKVDQCHQLDRESVEVDHRRRLDKRRGEAPAKDRKQGQLQGTLIREGASSPVRVLGQ
jgi:hypothetical protein